MKKLTAFLIIIALLIVFVGVLPTAFADSNSRGSVTLDSADGDIIAGTLQARVEATGINSAADIMELHIGSDVSGDLNHIDIAYINTMVNIEVLDVASSIIVGNVGDNFCRNYSTEFTKLREVTFPATIFGKCAFYYCTALTTMSLPNAAILGNYSLISCSALTTVILPKVTNFGNSAFKYCRALRTVSLPNATIFGDGAFKNCSALTTVSLPKATTFGHVTFVNCSALTTVIMPCVTSFGDRTFVGCPALSNLLIGEMPTSIGSEFGAGNGSASVQIPEINISDYRNYNDGDISDNKWRGYTIVGYSGGLIHYYSNNATGGIVPIDDNGYSSNAQVTVLGNTGNLSRFAYTFNGWNTQEDGNGTTYQPNDTFNITGNVNLYAMWKGYHITLNNTGGSGEVSVTVEYRSEMPSGVSLPTRSGYTFLGYYRNIHEEETKYYNSDMTSAKEWDILNESTLYAKWIENTTPSTYTVEFASQSGSNVSDQTIVGGNYASRPTNPTRSGYTFGGWYTDSDCTDGNWWNFNACQVTTDTTLYAKWESITEPKTDVTTVSLSYGSKSMFVDDVFALTAIVLPDDATDPDVVWDSSDYTVAMVNSAGVVTATGIGTATISATADGVTDSCKVTVNPDPDVDVSEVKLTLASDFSAIMYVGDTTLLEAFVSPSDATVQSVTWSSSDASVATVNSQGKVTAVSVGDVKITAEAQGKKDTYNISVKAKDAADATPTPAPTDAPTPEPTQKAEATPTPEEVVVVVEIDVTKLPEGTKYIKLPNGDVVEINGEDTLTIEVLEDELDVNGGVEIIALDDEQMALGSVAIEEMELKTVQKQVADSVPAWKIALVGALMLIVGVGGTLLVQAVVMGRKR